MKEVVEKLLAVEAKAQEVLAAAEADAERVAQEARDEAQRLAQTIREKATESAARTVEDAVNDANARKAKTLTEADRQAEHLATVTNDLRADAERVVVDTLTGRTAGTT